MKKKYHKIIACLGLGILLESCIVVPPVHICNDRIAICHDRCYKLQLDDECHRDCNRNGEKCKSTQGNCFNRCYDEEED